ncbi:hypothetical protein ES703_107339 [subsurface metagenome]
MQNTASHASWFRLEKAVDGTLGFGIELPIENYGKDQFLEAVRREGEKRLKGILKDDAAKREQQRQEKARQRDLDSLVSQIKSMISK